jgi:hypothetical protein
MTEKKGRLRGRLAGAAGALSLAGAVLLVTARPQLPKAVSPLDVLLLVAFAVVSGTYAILDSADRKRGSSEGGDPQHEP